MKLYDLAESGDVEGILSRRWSDDQLNLRDENGHTALMKAAIRGDYRVADALKKSGADIDILDNDSRKAVHLAALFGHSVVIAYLIEGGCGG